MRKSFKYRLYPTQEQQAKIQFTLERCRLLYNRLLEERILTYKETGKTLNYYEQANSFNERKQYIPSLKQVHSQVLQDVAKRLDKAFQAFFRRVKSGDKPGFPRFKPKARYDSFTYPHGGYADSFLAYYNSILSQNMLEQILNCLIHIKIPPSQVHEISTIRFDFSQHT